MQSWEKLPSIMKNKCVKEYYLQLENKKYQLIFKRLFDIVFSIILLIMLSPVFFILGLWIKLDSKGPIFFRQVRVTQYYREFKIFKFRTMITDAEKIGTQVTLDNDSRVTKVGKIIRDYRLDELPQLINILLGDMSFVGTRPEVLKYVDCYSDEMKATLLLRAGVTSKCSIEYKDESYLLNGASDPDNVYIQEILPEKMKINLEEVQKFNLINDIKILLFTLKKVFK